MIETEHSLCPACGSPSHAGHLSSCVVSELEREKSDIERVTTTSLAIVRRLEQAIGDSIFADALQADRAKAMTAALENIWPEHEKVGQTFFRIDAIDPAIDGLRMMLAPRSYGGALKDHVRDFRYIRLGVGSIIDASTPEEIADARLKIGQIIVHEMEHTLAYGDDDPSGGEDPESRQRYFSNPGEKRAYAKMFAYKFVQLHPDMPFDMETFAPSTDPAKGDHWYFVHALQGDDLERKKIASDVVAMTTWYVNHFREL